MPIYSLFAAMMQCFVVVGGSLGCARNEFSLPWRGENHEANDHHCRSSTCIHGLSIGTMAFFLES